MGQDPTTFKVAGHDTLPPPLVLTPEPRHTPNSIPQLPGGHFLGAPTVPIFPRSFFPNYKGRNEDVCNQMRPKMRRGREREGGGREGERQLIRASH